MTDYNPDNLNSILEFASLLKNKTLRTVCEDDIKNHGLKGKGNFGQVLEKYYFGYDLNSNSEPDFLEAGIELKASPLKTLKNKSIRSKERLVLNIINYMEVHDEEFKSSSFWKKNAHLLLVFYLHDKEKDFLDYVIKLVDDWRYPSNDLQIIKNDWETIQNKIKQGQAHEISEGDTFYLGACTKGSTAAKSLREQPFNTVKAKQRAYSLKQGYVNHIIAHIAKEEQAEYGKIIKAPLSDNESNSLEDIVIARFKPFYGWTDIQIAEKFDLLTHIKAKHFHSMLTKAILGVGTSQKIEEFEKADIQTKTIRVSEKGLPRENISFPNFKYQEIVKKSWDDSDFKKILEQKFFFVFYEIVDSKLKLLKVKFWNMPQSDIEEGKKVWLKTVGLIKTGEIIKSVSLKGVRKTNFPKQSENKVCHVRPHAKNAADTYKLPVMEKLTGQWEYTKHCFWLNAAYIKTQILEHND